MTGQTPNTLKIIQYGHPSLRERCEPVEEFNDELRELAEAMFRAMNASEGVGLAASQVGHLIRLLVVGVPVKESDEVIRMAVVNPEILESSSSWEYEEGCLSIPDVRDMVTRAERIKLRYQDLEGEFHEIEATDLLGRVFLHEIDHLNGVLFVDYLSPVRRAIHNGKLKKLARETAGQLEAEA